MVTEVKNMKRKTKKTLLVLSSFFMLTGFAISLTDTKTVKADDTQVSTSVNEEDLRQAEVAKDNLYLNVDLNNVVSNLYLPSKGVYGAKISWESSDTVYINPTSGLVRRPTDGQARDVVLTATITVRTASVKKDFNAHILPFVSSTYERPLHFEENFSNYKTGQDLSNYYIWELKNGDEIAKVKESVENNNIINTSASVNKVLEIEPLPTLYKDCIYQTKVNIGKSMVFEGYFMTSGESAGFQIEFGTNSSTKLTLGMIDGNFVAGETLTPYDEGVWYRLRIEMNTTTGLFNAYYYDWNNNGSLVSLTKSGGESCKGLTASKDSYFKMRTLTGRHSSKTYVADIVLDEADKVSVSSPTNPNRTLGIGKVDNFVSSYLLVENEDFVLPNLVVHNRFLNKEILTEGTDYILKKEYGESGEFDITKQGNYEIKYTITLLKDGQPYETKVLNQTLYVDEQNGTAKLDTLRIAPIVRDSDETYVDKKIKLSANINRKDATVYYSAVESGKSALTKDQIVAGQGAINGHMAINDASFLIEIDSLAKNKEYDFYVVTKNKNGISDVYTKTKISVSVYNIEDREDFFFMCTDPEVQTTDFRLLNDLDFSDYFWEANEITRPNYVGTFDGQGHTISNLNINAPYKKASLFYQFAGTFKNLTFESCTLKGHESVGFIGGYGAGGAHVKNIVMNNCNVECDDTMLAGDGYYGLIFGRCEGGSKGGNAIIENVEITNGFVTGPKYVGALVGNLQKMTSLTIENVYVSAKLSSDGAALGLVSRARVPLNMKNIVADINIVYAKKQAAVLCGEISSAVYAENILGKLKIDGMTQPTYYNNVTGNYSSVEGSKFTYKNVFFFDPDTSLMSEEGVTPVKTTLSVGTILYGDFGTTKEWWEKNTWLVDLDTNSNWYFDSVKMRPSVKERDMSTLSFTAAEINAYIDSIGDTITSNSLYYIRKAQELLKYCKESEKSQIHTDTLNNAIAKYNEYYASFEGAISSSNSVNSSILGGINWGFTPKGDN